MGSKCGTYNILWHPQGAIMLHQVIHNHIHASHSVAIGKIDLPPWRATVATDNVKIPAKKPQKQCIQH